MKKLCSIEDCDGAHHARSWCHKHYLRWKSTGDPLKVKPRYGARKTHCKQGHSLSGDNVRIRTVGERTVQVCKACSRETVYSLRARRRAARGES